jgi:plasmid stabilization system protein ParE
MKVRYTAAGRTEIEDILARIATDNPAAATAVGSAIKATIARIRSFPRIGADTDVPEIFLSIVRPYRYLIFYKIRSDTIVIRNVRHPARQRPPTDQS